MNIRYLISRPDLDRITESLMAAAFQLYPDSLRYHGYGEIPSEVKVTDQMKRAMGYLKLRERLMMECEIGLDTET